jgi:hypothetical protein
MVGYHAQLKECRTRTERESRIAFANDTIGGYGALLRLLCKGSDLMKQILFAGAVMLSALAGCYNPFFPPVGAPLKGVSAATPQIVITRLMNAYESRRIDLFEDLFNTADFRFYVSPNFNADYQGKVYANPMEQIDSNYHEIYYLNSTQSFYYWTYAYEKQSHSNLFDRSTWISFDQPLTIQTLLYSISSGGDTTMAEVVTSGGKLSIYSRRSPADPLELFEVDIQKQVFYLKKDESGSWKIFKWFDLSNAPSLIS